MNAEWVIGLAALALRIGLGVEMMAHGWPKLKDPKPVSGFIGQMGLKPALFWTWVVALQELFGGLLLVLGLLTRLAALGFAIEFLVIILYVKRVKIKQPFSTPTGQAGWEWDWLILAMALGLLFLGSGTFGVDRALGELATWPFPK